MNFTGLQNNNSNQSLFSKITTSIFSLRPRLELFSFSNRSNGIIQLTSRKFTPSSSAAEIKAGRGECGHKLQELSSGVQAAIVARLKGHCWNCGKRIPEAFSYNATDIRDAFFCRNCGSILPLPKQTNYFSIFGLKESSTGNNESSLCPGSNTFDFDVCKNKKIYNKIQTMLHPDSFATSCCNDDESDDNCNSSFSSTIQRCDNKKKNSEKRFYKQLQKELATEATSLVNQAYMALKDPVARAEYIMKTVVPCSTKSKSELTTCGEPDKNDSGSPVDKMFLFWQMDVREQIDRSTSPEDLQKIMQDISKRFTKASTDFAAAFCRNDSQAMSSALSTMRFLRQTETEVKGKMFDVMH